MSLLQSEIEARLLVSISRDRPASSYTKLIKDVM